MGEQWTEKPSPFAKGATLNLGNQPKSPLDNNLKREILKIVNCDGPLDQRSTMITRKVAMTKRIPHSATPYCSLVGEVVTLKWTEVVIPDGLDSRPPQLGDRSCSKAGRGACPVVAGVVQTGWSDCPHLPKY